jgi:glycosyltransferase involved in cell wall biosynthesis
VTARSILLVTLYAPPSTLVAARRTAGLAKYLSRLGHRVGVLTSDLSGQGEIEGADVVVRTPDLLTSRLNWRRDHFAALTGAAPVEYRPPSRLQDLIVPDIAAVSWLPFALPRALRLAGSFECVVTTSPPQSAHAIGAALLRRGLPWIAELRDGWTFEPPRARWPLRVQRRLDAALEARVLRRASAVVGVTEPIVADAKRRLGTRAALITNGFDPEERVAADGAALLDPRRISLVHTGRMGSSGSTPRPLVEAVRRLRREQPRVAAALEVVFAGPLQTAEAELLAAPDLAGFVRSVGMLERPQALGLQRAADWLLVVTEGAARRSVATGKLFEYLAARRPILVLGAETEAARIVAEARAGFATSAEDAGEIASALERLVHAPPPRADETVVARYAYPEIARRYSELIEEVVGRAHAGETAAATSSGR